MGGGRADQMKLVKDLRKQGFEVERTGGGHWRVSKDDGPPVIMSFSPSRTVQHKTLKRLREIGYQE